MIINDDVASAPVDKKQNRRGVAGLVPVVKLAKTQLPRLTRLMNWPALLKRPWT